MRRIIATLIIMSVSYMGMLNCVGPFKLTVKVHKFVRGIKDKWVSEIVFLVFIIIPIYAISTFLDAILFNSIEFWTGNNPISHNEYDGNGEYRKEEIQGNVKTVYTYKKYGQELEISMLHDGRLKKAILLKQDEPGVLYAKKDGRTERLKVLVKNQDDKKIVTIIEGDRITAVKEIPAKHISQIMNSIGDRYALVPANGAIY